MDYTMQLMCQGLADTSSEDEYEQVSFDPYERICRTPEERNTAASPLGKQHSSVSYLYLVKRYIRYSMFWVFRATTAQHLSTK